MPDNQIMGVTMTGQTAEDFLVHSIEERSIRVPEMGLTPDMVSSFVVARSDGKKLVVFSAIYGNEARTPEVRFRYAVEIAESLMAFAAKYQRECETVEVRVHTDRASDDEVWVRYTHVGSFSEFDKWIEDKGARRPISLQLKDRKAMLDELGVGKSLEQREADKRRRDAGNPHPPGMG